MHQQKKKSDFDGVRVITAEDHAKGLSPLN